MPLLAIALAACAVVGTVERPAAGGTFREAVVGQPLSLNPLLDPLDPIVRDVRHFLFAGLVRVVDGGEIQGDLAERWTTEDGGRTYVFHLRAGATWHDGRAVTAADVVSTVEILGAAEYPGPRELGALWRTVTAEALDTRIVRLRLDEPYSSFIEACSLPILPGHLFRPGEVTAMRENPASYEPIGAGPFKVEEVTLEGLRLTRHSGYVGARPYLQRVEVVYFADAPSAAAALHGGVVDAFAGAPGGNFQGTADGRQLITHAAPLQGQQLTLLANHRNPLLADGRVRLALAAGIDRRRLLEEVAGSDAAPAFGPIPAFSWAYAPLVESEVDLVGARSLLDAAGWSGGTPRRQGQRELRFQLLVPMESRLVGWAEGLKAQLAGVGVQIDLQPTDLLDLYRERLAPRQFELALVNIGLGSADPDPFPLWDSSQAAGGFNFVSYRRDEVDALLRTARTDGDPGARRAALRDFQQLWVSDVPSVVLANPMLSYVVADRIRGLRLGVVPQPGARFQHFAEWYVNTERVPALLS